MIKAVTATMQPASPCFWWIIGGIFSIPPIICYFCIYHDGLSSDYNAWIAFGTLWGAVFGSLAFIIAIRTVYEGVRMPSGNRFLICSACISRKSRRSYIRRTEIQYPDMTHSEPIPDRRINILHYI